tara:strand:+ start:826 stop:2190 length:1365 start_codon:yes stop_codon:yes gene_type:complete
MAEIKFDDLLKEFTGTTVPRWTALVSKIANKEKFTLNKSTTEVTITYLTKEIEGLFKDGKIVFIQNNYRGKPLFKANNGAQLKLSDLFKSADFGGGKGSGGGAEETERNESAQCLYAALVYYVYNKPMHINKAPSKKDFVDAFKHCDVSAKFEDLLDLPYHWHYSSILGANKLREQCKGAYEFHRGSSTVGIIENKFKEINRKEKAFGNLNKWSPADIYMFTNKGKMVVRSEISQATTIQGLNNIMLKYIKSKDIVGVSLKKIDGKRAKLTENNMSDNKTSVNYTGYQIVANNKTDMFDSMDVYLEHSKGKTQFRSFGGTNLTGWQGEGKGATANQGKISLGPLNFILQANGVKKLPESQVSARMATSPNSSYFAEFYSTAKKLKTKGLDPSQKGFMARWYRAPNPWKYSKYLGILLVDRIDSLPAAKRNNVMTDIFLYSASKSNFAGPYLKLE